MRLDRLLSLLESNPMYQVRRLDDHVELVALAPSAQEAASASDVPTFDQRYVVIIIKDMNGEAVPVEAYVESGSGRRPIDLDEIKWWLDLLDSSATP